MSGDKPGRALKATWVDHGRERQNPTNPQFPNGVDLDMAGPHRPRCRIELKYPARRCGVWAIECRLCGLSIAVTATGRADDPRSVTVRCKPLKGLGG